MLCAISLSRKVLIGLFGSFTAEKSTSFGGVGVGGRAAGRRRPEPLGVGGEALVEPDVPPVGDREAVAEPLVRQLVGGQPLVGAPPVQVVAAEDGHALRLDRVVEVVVGDHHHVLAERVRAEHALQRGHDLAHGSMV